MVALLGLVSCGGGGPVGPRAKYAAEVTPAVEREYRQAERIYQVGNYSEAAGRFQSFIDKYPYNRLTDRSYYRLGEIYLHSNQFSEALRFFEKVTSRSFDPDLGPQAMYKEAVCHTRMKEYGESKTVLRKIPHKYANVRLRIRIGSLWIEDAKQLGEAENEKSLGFLNLYDAYKDSSFSGKVGGAPWIVEKQEVVDFVEKWVREGNEDPDRLQDWAKNFSGRPVGGVILWKLIQTHNTKGNYAKAKSLAQEFAKTYPKHEYLPLVRSLLSETEKRTGTGDEVVIGVLLPLSGRFSVAAESVLRGLECAAGVFDPCEVTVHSANSVRLIVRDSGEGEAEKAVGQLQQLVAEGAVAVVALLIRDETETVVQEANRLAVPLIALSPREAVSWGDYVFRNFLTVSEQVATIVQYACSRKKVGTYAILYPETPVGKEFEKNFAEQVNECGGKVVTKQSYLPDTTDFMTPLRNLKMGVTHYGLGSGYGFQALFIPDTYKNLLLIADAMRFVEMKGLLLLGSAGWDHPSLAAGDNELLTNAVFPDGFFIHASRKATHEFTDSFKAAYAMDPTFLEAYAYDSLKIILATTKGASPKGRFVREEIKDFLSRLKDFSGATGMITAEKGGELKRKLFLLTLADEGIREVE
ncbi:MAG: ABC transporter substrate-binding protein [Deltaproteobacteria bacterium]|nr:ABC transporter substrate-binding protein [Deltaproteobacteria bacterium]